MNRCLCCGKLIDPTEQPYLRGLVINRRASLSARLVQMKEQFKRNNLHMTRELMPKQIVLGDQILNAQKELDNVRELERSLS